jgi:uncharacterized MAPEG superfamily protein
MSILGTLPTGKYLTPYYERLLNLIPKEYVFADPLSGLTHAATVVYAPMFLRIFVQARLGRSKGYDNLDPRAQIARFMGKSQIFSRLHNSHVNGLESFPFFAAAVLGGLHAGIERSRLCRITTMWVLVRVLYVAAYLLQTKKTSFIRSLLFLYSLAMGMNLLRESGKKLLCSPKAD